MKSKIYAKGAINIKICEVLDEENIPCVSCEYYDDGEVREDGEEFHEFLCSGGYCLFCSERNGFQCFKKKGVDQDDN